MKASLGRRLPCEASLGWRVVCVLLAIVFSVAGAVPLAGQEPLATQRPGTQRAPDTQRHGTPTGTRRGADRRWRGGTQGTPTGTWGSGDRGWRDADSVIVLGALAAISVVAFIVRRFKRNKEKKNDPRPPPKVEVVPVKDYGEQHVAPSPPVFAVELCPVLDPGDQALEKIGPLVEQRGGPWTSNVQR